MLRRRCPSRAEATSPKRGERPTSVVGRGVTGRPAILPQSSQSTPLELVVEGARVSRRRSSRSTPASPTRTFTPYINPSSPSCNPYRTWPARRNLPRRRPRDMASLDAARTRPRRQPRTLRRPDPAAHVEASLLATVVSMKHELAGPDAHAGRPCDRELLVAQAGLRLISHHLPQLAGCSAVGARAAIGRRTEQAAKRI